MRRVIAGCGAVLALLIFPVGAGADVGALSPLGASSATGLIGAWDVAVSADSKSVYVVGNGSDTIVTFSRDPATGALTPQGCIADVGDAAGCGETQQGLDGAIGVAVTPDGKSVYVASEKDHAVARFNRAPDGKLTPAGCIADAGDPSATGCGATQEGLLQANDIVANNKSVYVVSRGDHALVHFDRPTVEPVTGEIVGQGCIEDVGSPAACSGETEGLLDAQAVTISADGKSVYVVSREEDAIVRFARNEEGSLVAQGCISDVGGADCGLGNTQQGLGGARDVAVSGDGKSVYVASQGDSAVVRFTRGVNGELSGQGCVEDVGGAAGCGVTQEGLSGAYGVAVSPDSLSAYVVGSSDHAIARFDRGADGALTPRGSTTAPGMGFPLRLAVSRQHLGIRAGQRQQQRLRILPCHHGGLGAPDGDAVGRANDAASAGLSQQHLRDRVGVRAETQWHRHLRRQSPRRRNHSRPRHGRGDGAAAEGSPSQGIRKGKCEDDHDRP